MECAKADTPELVPFVSVIVPVRNSPERIARCIEALQDQTYPEDRFEIIIVDNGSTDETPDVIRRYPVVYREETSVQSPYAARNKGIEAARGDIIALIDANCFATPRWLEEAVATMTGEQADLVGGRVTFLFPGREKSAAEMYDSLSNVKMKESIEGRKVAKGGNLLVRKEVFTKIGLFPGHIRSGMDVFWTGKASRAGCKLVYSEKAEVRYPARGLMPLLKKSYRVGRGIPRIWREEGVSRVNILKRIVSGFRPVSAAFIRDNIKKRGSEDMNRKFRRIWLVAWMCAIASNFGKISFFFQMWPSQRGSKYPED